MRDRGDPTEAGLRAVLDVRSERISFEEHGNALLAGANDDVVGPHEINDGECDCGIKFDRDEDGNVLFEDEE